MSRFEKGRNRVRNHHQTQHQQDRTRQQTRFVSSPSDNRQVEQSQSLEQNNGRANRLLFGDYLKEKDNVVARKTVSTDVPMTSELFSETFRRFSKNTAKHYQIPNTTKSTSTTPILPSPTTIIYELLNADPDHLQKQQRTANNVIYHMTLNQQIIADAERSKNGGNYHGNIGMLKFSASEHEMKESEVVGLFPSNNSEQAE